WRHVFGRLRPTCRSSRGAAPRRYLGAAHGRASGIRDLTFGTRIPETTALSHCAINIPLTWAGLRMLPPPPALIKTMTCARGFALAAHSRHSRPVTTSYNGSRNLSARRATAHRRGAERLPLRGVY